MSVDWEKFEKILINYIKSYQAKSENDFATKIANTYDSVIRTGASEILYGNIPRLTNKQALESALKSAFKLSKASVNKDYVTRTIKGLFALGVINYWTGAQFGFEKPPLGSTNILSNIVTSPGIPPILVVSNTNNLENIVKIMSAQLRIHLTTVTGLTIALVNIGGVPTPTPFPWSVVK